MLDTRRSAELFSEAQTLLPGGVDSPQFKSALARESSAAARAFEHAAHVASPLDTATAKFDLSVYVWEEANRLTGVFEYNTDLFEAATIDRMVGHFQTLLEAIVAAPDRSIATLPILPAAERQQLLLDRAYNDDEDLRTHVESIRTTPKSSLRRLSRTTGSGAKPTNRDLKLRSSAPASCSTPWPFTSPSASTCAKWSDSGSA